MIDVETSTNCGFALSTQRATLYRSMSFFGTEGFFFAKDRKKMVITECNTNYLFPQRPCVNRDPLTQSICERIFLVLSMYSKASMHTASVTGDVLCHVKVYQQIGLIKKLL